MGRGEVVRGAGDPSVPKLHGTLDVTIRTLEALQERLRSDVAPTEQELKSWIYLFEFMIQGTGFVSHTLKGLDL